MNSDVVEGPGVNSQPTKTCLPAGNRISYEYDLNSNVIKATRNAKSLPNLVKTLVPSAIYDPTFNKPIQITDPRGLVTTLACDAGGNLLSVGANSTGSPKAHTGYTYTGASLPLSVPTTSTPRARSGRAGRTIFRSRSSPTATV